jgi:hypothetical protein
LVGLLSIIITNVFGSGGFEQEEEVNKIAAKETPNKLVILSEAKDLLLADSARQQAFAKNRATTTPPSRLERTARNPL